MNYISIGLNPSTSQASAFVNKEACQTTHENNLLRPIEYPTEYSFDMSLDCLCTKYPKNISYWVWEENSNTFVGRMVRRIGAQFPAGLGYYKLPAINTK